MDKIEIKEKEINENLVLYDAHIIFLEDCYVNGCVIAYRIEVKKRLTVNGFIRATSVIGGEGSITADRIIEAHDLSVGGDVSAYAIDVSNYIGVDGKVTSKTYIRSGRWISVGKELKAGTFIAADEYIKAPVIVVGKGHKIFAGLSAREDEVQKQEIQASRVEGKIGYGKLKRI